MASERDQEVCGLWLKDKNGVKYMTGTTKEGVRYTVFRNKFKKEGDKQPEYRLLCTPSAQQTPSSSAETPDEDVPF